MFYSSDEDRFHYARFRMTISKSCRFLRASATRLCTYTHYIRLRNCRSGEGAKYNISRWRNFITRATLRYRIGRSAILPADNFVLFPTRVIYRDYSLPRDSDITRALFIEWRSIVFIQKSVHFSLDRDCPFKKITRTRSGKRFRKI